MRAFLLAVISLCHLTASGSELRDIAIPEGQTVHLAFPQAITVTHSGNLGLESAGSHLWITGASTPETALVSGADGTTWVLRVRPPEQPAAPWVSVAIPPFSHDDHTSPDRLARVLMRSLTDGAAIPAGISPLIPRAAPTWMCVTSSPLLCAGVIEMTPVGAWRGSQWRADAYFARNTAREAVAFEPHALSHAIAPVLMAFTRRVLDSAATDATARLLIIIITRAE